MENFTNIMDQSEQFPLNIHLALFAKGEMVHTFVNSDIGKDRFDNSQTPGVDHPAVRIVDLRLHPFDQIWGLAHHHNGERTVLHIWLAQAV